MSEMEKESGEAPGGGDDVRTAGLGAPPDLEQIESLPWLDG